MPYALIVAGLLLLVSSVRNTQGDLFKLLEGDFTGQHNFVYWFASIMAVGWLGYIPRVKPITDAILILIILVLFLSNKGFFAQLSAGLNSTQSQPINPTGAGLPPLPALPKLF